MAISTQEEGVSGIHCERTELYNIMTFDQNDKLIKQNRPTLYSFILISDCNNEMDLVFLFDSSISVGREKFKKMKEFAKQVIAPLEFASGRTQVSVITFSNEADVQFFVSQHEL